MTDREIMQQALDALELLAWCENPATRVQVRKPKGGGNIVTVYPHKVATEAAAPLRERLAQQEQEQEPVAWQVMVEDEAMKEFSIKDMAHDWCVQQKLYGSSYTYWIRPLYTAPQPAQQPQYDKTEMNAFVINLYDQKMREGKHGHYETMFHVVHRAIEAAHGIGEKK